MIDARTHHDPAKAPGLVQKAIQVAGTQQELAARLGVTRETIANIKTQRTPMSYVMQIALESVINHD